MSQSPTDPQSVNPPSTIGASPHQPRSASELLTAYARGDRTFVNWNLADADLRNATLKDANFCRANLKGANLSEADLTRCNFSQAVLTTANLHGANISGAHFDGAVTFGADLTDTITDRPTPREARPAAAPAPQTPNLSFVDPRQLETGVQQMTSPSATPESIQLGRLLGEYSTNYLSAVLSVLVGVAGVVIGIHGISYTDHYAYVDIVHEMGPFTRTIFAVLGIGVLAYTYLFILGTRLTVFEHGFIFARRSSETTVRWDEMVGMNHTASRTIVLYVIPLPWKNHKIGVRLKNGSTVHIVSEQLSNAVEAGETLERLWRQHVHRNQQGNAV